MKKSLIGLVAIGALIAGPAMAADLGMPVKAPPAPIAPPCIWCGFYIGGNVGGSWGDVPESFNLPAVPNANPLLAVPAINVTNTAHPDSVIGGVQLGYNWQFNNIVLGVETDFDGRDAKSSFSCFVTGGPGCTGAPPSLLGLNDEQVWLGTFRGRFGVTWDRVLVYGTGGLAYGDVKHSLIENQVGSAILTVSDDKTMTGWAAGGGIQYAFNDQWSVGVEYLHVDLGTDTLINPGVTVGGVGFTPSSASFHDRSDIVRGRLDWRFNWGGPIATRY